MIKLYFHHTPNPLKVALYLEEAGLPYEVIPVDVFKGEQHTPEFRRINPNGKLPAIEDDGVRVFDSNAILLYLAEKTGQFMGKPEDRAELLSWFMFVGTGLGPYSGQSVHFRHMAPEKIPYAINRYHREAHRHYEILEAHLEGREFMVGDEYTIADISTWGWVDRAPIVLGENALDDYPNIKRWFAKIDARPGVEKARNIAADIPFKKEMDEETLRAMFPQNFAEQADA